MSVWSSIKDVASGVAGVFTGSSPWSGAINAGMNLLGDIGGNIWSNANAISAAQRDDRYAKGLMDYQNEYNRPINQMARYKEAGLNPNLIYGQSNLSASGSASASAARAQAPQLRFMEYNKDKAMIENMRVNNQNLRAQTLNLQAQNGLIGAQQAEAGARMAESLQRASMLGAQQRHQEIENKMAAYNAGYSEAQYRQFLKTGEIPKKFAGMSKSEQYRDDMTTGILKSGLDAMKGVFDSAIDKLYQWKAGNTSTVKNYFYNSNNRTNTSNSYTDSSTRSVSNTSNNSAYGYSRERR